MARPLLTLTLLALALPSQAARAQGAAPGDTPTWERVGDFPPDANALASDGAGRLYAITFDGAYRLDLTGGFPGVWEERNCCVFGDAMIGLGPDTLVTTLDGRTRRSTDGGVTWVNVRDAGSGDAFGLHEAPAGTPLAGTLFVGGLFAASEDRGATWETRGQIPDLGGLATAFATLASGRLAAAAAWGAAYSDDGGWTWEMSNLWGFNRFLTKAVAVTEAPGGTERVVVVGVDATAPHVRAWYSDDGGQTWLPEGGYPLPEPADGVGGGRTSGVWAAGGSRVVAVLGRGSVYGSEDGGETWQEVGQLPDIAENIYAHTSAVGRDGRLYVALNRIGTEEAWVWRTEQRVAPPVLRALQRSARAPVSGRSRARSCRTRRGPPRARTSPR